MERHNISLVVARVIGALCTLTLALIVGIIVLVWREYHRRQCSYATDTERSSYGSDYSSLGHTIPSFTGLGSFSAVRGPRSSSPPQPALRTSMELERDTDYASVPPRPEGSIMSLPDNLYMPVC